MNTQPNCESRVESEMAATMKTLGKLVKAYQDGEPDRHACDMGSLYDYGLGFDYVAPETFPDQPEGYFRYQLAWGGPSEEFRFFVNPDMSLHRIEYWFMDWFDGASRTLEGEDRQLLAEVFDFFEGFGRVGIEYDRATD